MEMEMEMEIITHPYSMIVFSLMAMAATSYWILKTLKFSHNLWAESSFLIYSAFLLPQISYVITKVISGNIALSLGMVGALSIVRFRHPVKNPLELVTYFALIALGISFSVNIKWGVLLGFLFVFSLVFIHRFLIHSPKPETDTLVVYSVSVITEQPIPMLLESSNLSYFEFKSTDSEYVYRLEFSNRFALNEQINNLANFKVKQIIANA